MIQAFTGGCEHHYETRILGGHPLTVRICYFCRSPDWADLSEQVERLRRPGESAHVDVSRETSSPDH